ncbi:MAG: hypothetical protein JAY90_18580 [Candidatus Thiodiazotropha lotti]|nr:hypothetical protein [Candidatus Thiodiazotropha lotti]
MLIHNNLIGFGAGGGGPLEITNTDTETATSVSGTTTHTFSSASFGDANSTRRIVVAVADCFSGIVQSITGMTIGGITATEIIAQLNAISLNTVETVIYYADVPTGTTGDIVITWSHNMSTSMYGFGISVYRLINAKSMTPTDTASDTTDPITLDLDIPSGKSVVIAAAGCSAGTGITWTGLSNEDVVYNPSGSWRLEVARDSFTTEETGRTIEADCITYYSNACGVSMVLQ